MFSRVLARRVVALAILVSTLALSYFAFRSHAASPAAEAQHGLTGNYYLGNRGWLTDAPPPANGFYQTWSDPNDFMLPRAITTPAATRVDAEVAFGQGKGFHVGPQGPQLVWWPTGFGIPQGWGSSHSAADKPWQANHFAAVIWRGYIHLPKAGTYYFGTVSNGASAVYLNQARVALNGWGGGELVSDAFSYANEQVQDFVTQGSSGKQSYLGDSRFQYAVPVPMDGPRDLPIEVDYDIAESPSGWGNVALGIDLFWVTPDSPRDANGKPSASIVPSDALYTEAPGLIEKPVVHSANSTISADFLYSYFPSDKSVTVTVRLADKDGNPVAGKRVSLSTVGAVGHGYPDEIVQPEKATNEQGETTGTIRVNKAYPVPHDMTIFATDVTDYVDVAQVAHVSFLPYVASFFPQSFSPYYDPRGFRVEPLPMRVGKPLTITVPLENGGKYPGEVSIIFKRNDWNIGVPVWNEVIGEVKNIRLNPHEHRDVSITWTPKKESGHQCFRVELQGHWIVSSLGSVHPLAASVLPALAWQAGGSQNVPVSDSKQQNVGAVQPPPCEIQSRTGGLYVPEGVVGPKGCTPSDPMKTWCRWRIEDMNKLIRILYEALSNDYAAKDVEGEKDDVDLIEQAEKYRADFKRCWDDPPNPSYRHLAPAASDTAGAYVEAMTASMERYQAAQSQGDTEWMARQFSAAKLYLKQYAQAIRATADAAQKKAESLPEGDSTALAKIQATRDQFLARWRQGQRFTPEELSSLKRAGISEQRLTAALDAIVALKEIPTVKSPRTVLLETAAEDRKSADAADQLANAPANSGEEGKPGQPLIQTYSLANPHDRQETVDLFIRPISIPSDWKLSIANAEEDQAGQQASKPGGTQPKYPVHEIDPGKHYNVALPAKAETKVASVVIPVGEIGARTTARWAVEGKIGNELIGGMVHEMNVPYIIPDLQLPPVGSKEAEEELPVPGRPWARLVAELAAAVVVVGLFLFFFLWRRRRHTITGA